MYKNPRTLKILQSVDYGESEQEITIPQSSEINSGSYVIQDNGLLLLDEHETDTVNISGTPSNILICNDRSLRKLSSSSSTGSVSLITDSVRHSSSDITNVDLPIIIDAQETHSLFSQPILFPSEEVICNTEHIMTDPSSVPESANISMVDVSLFMASVEYPRSEDTNHNIVEKEIVLEALDEPLNEPVLYPLEKSLENIEQNMIDSPPVPESNNGQVNVSTGTRVLSSIENLKTKANAYSSSEAIINCQNDSIEEITASQKKRQKKSCPQDWSANINKEKREKGKPYLGKKKIHDKWSFIEPKNERKIKDRCNCKLSLKGDTKLECHKIPEEERQHGFKKFWNMSWNEKKLYMKMSSVCKRKQRVRCTGTSSRRENSVELYLIDSTGNRYRVCKKMFLNSLCLGEWAIKKWIINDSTPMNMPKNNAKTVPHQQLRKFFDSLPKLESHYCRKNSSKLYLDPLWTSKSQLYKAYKEDFCLREKAEPLSIASFCNTFDDLNLSLFRPKKDLCETCESFKAGNITESEFKVHEDMKTEAREELAKDTATNNEVLTMDLQSVLLSPRSNVSALYYRTKLIVHNFTMYDVKRNKGFCYIWNEAEGKLTSNEFSTIIITALGKFIDQHSITSDQELIVYSDGCTYQNRNAVLSNALLNFSMQNKITVIQKYLEKGHTQMECDSMHSVIERAMRHKKINVPADYAHLAKIACKKNPYEVDYLYHHFFKDIEHTLTFYKSIRPGKRTGDPTVTNLRALKYDPNGKIVYKLRHSSTVWEELPIRQKKICFVPWDDIPQLYSTRLKIKKDKYMDLQALKSTMEKDYHKFYDDLPHF